MDEARSKKGIETVEREGRMKEEKVGKKDGEEKIEKRNGEKMRKRGD